MRHVHGPRRSTQQHPENRCASPRRVHAAQALLTLYGALDRRRRYAEGPGDAPLADSAGHHLDGRGLLLLGQPARSAQFLASRLRLLQTRLGTAAYGHQFLVGHPGGEAGQGIAQERLRRLGVGIQVLGQDCSLSAKLRILTPRRCRSWMLPMVSSQRRPIRSMDTTTRVSPCPSWESRECQPRRLFVPGARRRRHPDRCEKAPRRHPASAGVGFPGRCPPTRRLWGGWCGRSRRSRASLSLQLVRIAL